VRRRPDAHLVCFSSAVGTQAYKHAQAQRRGARHPVAPIQRCAPQRSAVARYAPIRPAPPDVRYAPLRLTTPRCAPLRPLCPAASRYIPIRPATPRDVLPRFFRFSSRLFSSRIFSRSSSSSSRPRSIFPSLSLSLSLYISPFASRALSRWLPHLVYRSSSFAFSLSRSDSIVVI
jgi:hypothetical protein